MLRQARVKFTLWAFAASASICCSPPLGAKTNEPYPVKTICEAVKLPIDDNGVKVTLKGAYSSDGYHYSFFIYETCPGITVLLYDGPNVVKDKVYEKFENIPFDDPLTTPSQIDVEISGTLRIFDGKYRFDAIRYIEVSD